MTQEEKDAYAEYDQLPRLSPQGDIVISPRSTREAREQSIEVRNRLPDERKPKPIYESRWHEITYDQNYAMGKTKRKKRRKPKPKRKKLTKKHKHKKRKSTRKK